MVLDASRLTNAAFAMRFPNAAAEAMKTVSSANPSTASTASEPGESSSPAYTFSRMASPSGLSEMCTFSRMASLLQEESCPEPPAELVCGASAVSGWLHFAAPQQIDHVTKLREEVQDENWSKHFQMGKTLCRAQASWCASPERCRILRSLCKLRGVNRVLEIGAFCGVGTLALAESVPKTGKVVSLELDPFFVAFAERYKNQTECGQRITMMTGFAMYNLKVLAGEIQAGKRAPFDMVVIDADKSNMQLYFDFLFDNNMLTREAVIILDTTKKASADEQHISAFKKAIKKAQQFLSHEFSGMVVVQSASQ